MISTNYIKNQLFAFKLLFILSLLITTPASADLMLSPTRVELDETHQQAVVKLINNSQVERAYRIDWSERKITDGGEMLTLPSGSNPKSITNMVRFSPRRVVVKPGENQTIRLNYKPPKNLPDGEYRSHLTIRVEPQAATMGQPLENKEKPQGLTFRMEVLLSYSLPVVVRHGPPNVNVAITSIKPEIVDRGKDGKLDALRVDMSRSGEFGTYGRIMVFQQMDANSPTVEIGQPANASLYQEVSQQSHQVLLKPGSQLRPGSWLRVIYEGLGRDSGKVFAERTFQLSK